MKYLHTIFYLLVLSVITAAQDTVQEVRQSLMLEGKRLYQSEMASWYGTDIFLAAYKKQENIGGYFSYTEENTVKCIFFSKTETPVVIGTMTFDSTYSVETAVTSLKERPFTKTESDLYHIRTEAFKQINNDTLFKVYKKTNLNLIPLIADGEKKVYVLTGTTENGVVIFGNDYLLQFDDNNVLLSKKQLHKNIIWVNSDEKTKEGESVVGSAHTHLPETGDFISATDICTLMLYARFTKWKQHVVVTEHYLNIWDCTNNQLAIIPREAMDKINKDKKKKKDN